MNINRDNYEEYFLLYTDNELSDQERYVVKEFVLQNPDLQKELEMLQESILVPDKIIFENKESLLNNELAGSGIQEKLLLLLDDELDAGNAANIESAIKEDNEIAKEWQLLKQTKLTATDKILFTDKAILYKKEKGKLIPMGWRIAAAAVLIGFGLWSTIAYLNRTNDGAGSEDLATNPAGKPEPKESFKNLIEQPYRQDSVTVNTVATGKGKMSNDIKKIVEEKNTKSALPGDIKKVQPANDLVVKEPVSNKKPSNNLPVPVLEKINKNDGNNIDVASVPSLKKNEIKALDNPGINEAAQPYAINTAFTDNKDEKITYGFEEEEDQPKKTKVGGFFKKLNRVLQRKANIKTGSGDSFKVANLSFAVQ